MKNSIVANYKEHSSIHGDYEMFLQDMRDALVSIGDEWKVTVHNGNWRGQTGTLESEDWKKVANALLMHDGQCDTEIWVGEEDDTLEGICYHHDCPTGSTFYIRGFKNE